MNTDHILFDEEANDIYLPVAGAGPTEEQMAVIEAAIAWKQSYENDDFQDDAYKLKRYALRDAVVALEAVREEGGGQ